LLCRVFGRFAVLKAEEQHEEPKGTKVHEAGNPALLLKENINTNRTFAWLFFVQLCFLRALCVFLLTDQRF
jgi:hypothetical protein